MEGGTKGRREDAKDFIMIRMIRAYNDKKGK